MRLTILLFILMVSFKAMAVNDTIHSLIITETRMLETNQCYLEITNMGDSAIDLGQFKIGMWGGSSTLTPDGKTNTSAGFQCPDVSLAKGESYVFGAYKEYGPLQFKKGLRGSPERTLQIGMIERIDFPVYINEGTNDGDKDSIVHGKVTPDPNINFETRGYKPFGGQWAKNGFFIMQMFGSDSLGRDSVVVDQVGGMFQGDGGTNLDRTAVDQIDVAGVQNATANSYLVRRHSVTHGQLDFYGNRGLGLDDSEWIPIPINGGVLDHFRHCPWTVGNHGNYELNANTLVSDDIDVDFANKTLTVPWGVRRGDGIMNHFEVKPGISWKYIVTESSVEDSLSHVAQTGDTLVIYACGDKLETAGFRIITKEPAANATIVVPKSSLNGDGTVPGNIQTILSWPRVTEHDSGMDSIWGSRGGIPYATRVDTLLKSLEKPANASWEIVYASGNAKPDLSNGDKLKVTAQDGTEKEYFIAVNNYRASGDALLKAITWPDIPVFYKNIFGWEGDTIPNFGPKINNYNLEVPLLADGIPQLIATKNDMKASVEVIRAKSLSGTPEDRTITFIVTAEDDSTTNTYNIILHKEVSPSSIQPFEMEPFISEKVDNYGWSGGKVLEICNPGNQQLNLNDYMIAKGGGTPAEAITKANDYSGRYQKYIPGYKWAADEAGWDVAPYVAEKDLSVESKVEGSGVFTMGKAGGGFMNFDNPFMTMDVQFGNKVTDYYTYTNQWGEEVGDTPFNSTSGVFLFKITNDSVKQGLKPANDPADFKLIDAMGGAGSFHLGSKTNLGSPYTMMRKPEFIVGDTIPGHSFGGDDTPPESDSIQWTSIDIGYYWSINVPWNNCMYWILKDVGQHYFIPPTAYKSTVSSNFYIVSEGHTMNEEIKGVKTGTTVDGFYDLIQKADSGQTLMVLNNGAEITGSAVVSVDDSLKVISADKQNTSMYSIDVTADGLSPDALLTSSKYSVEVTTEPDGDVFGVGTVSGMEFGTTLNDALSNINKPAGASWTLVDENDYYISKKVLNFDTVYVDALVSPDVYIVVTAQDGVTGIRYQLFPQSIESDAIVTSSMFTVNQDKLLISLVPEGINVRNFMKNVTPCVGATIQLIDNAGYERTEGIVRADDLLKVTSSDGTKVVNYFISLLNLNQENRINFVYLISNTYGIDPVAYVVNDVPEGTSVSDFLANVDASQGADAFVYTSDGSKKEDGNITGSDVVKVMLEDGSMEVTYTFSDLTVGKKENSINQQIMLYPNPTNGQIKITNVEPGQSVRVYNLYGQVVLQSTIEGINKTISLDSEPAGIYMFIISDGQQIVGQYKAIKK